MARPRFVLLAMVLAGGLAYAGFQASNSQGSLTGPALGSDETIVGRVLQDGKAWILTAKDVLVRIDIAARAHTRFEVGPLAEDEHLWGLASVGGDTFWSIAGRSTLVQLSSGGRVMRRIAMGDLHTGLFGIGRELLYQLTNATPGNPALVIGPPGEQDRRPWGRMVIRELSLPRAQTTALNLVSCGTTMAARLPCWYPDQRVLTLTDASGSSSEITLADVAAVSADALLAEENPRRPVLDVLVTPDAELWVLGSGDAPESAAPGRRGGWLLARYTSDGHAIERIVLAEQARLLLGVTVDAVTLLAWDGSLFEVRR